VSWHESATDEAFGNDNLCFLATKAIITQRSQYIFKFKKLWEDAVSYYFWIALFILIIGLAIILLAMISIFKQRVYLDKDGNPIGSEIEIPFFGKVKTGLPAVALAFLGVVVVYIAADLMKFSGAHSQPDLIPFTGNITIDRKDLDELPDAIIVGLAPGDGNAAQLVQPENPTENKLEKSVTLKVPNSWSSYIAYGLAPGGKIRPKWQGIAAGQTKFDMELAP
jgi:hypothetical protein